MASVAEEPSRGKIAPTLPAAPASSTMPAPREMKRELTVSASSTRDVKRIPPPLKLEGATTAAESTHSGGHFPPISATNQGTHAIFHPPPPLIDPSQSPAFYGQFSPFPFSLPSPLHHHHHHPGHHPHHHPGHHPHHSFYASQSCPIMSPLAFPAVPYQPTPQQHGVDNGQSILHSPVPPVSTEQPSIFVFPPITDAGQPSPDSSSSEDTSAGTSPNPSPVAEMVHPQHYQSEPPPSQHFPIECPTPNLPLMSPIIPPFFTSTMTPTFSYDSYGFYHHHHDGFSQQQQQMQQMQQQHHQATAGCFHTGASTSTCEVHADFFKGVTHALC